MSEDQKTEEQKTTVGMTITAGVHHSAMFLRTNLCTAEVEDDRKVEVDLNVDNSILVTVNRADGTWTTYSVGLAEFVRAALRAEG